MFGFVDSLYLQVSPMKGVKRFGKKDKLSPRYIGPLEILHIVGEVAYKLDFPLDFTTVHVVFNASLLWCYIPDESHMLWLDMIQLDD